MDNTNKYLDVEYTREILDNENYKENIIDLKISEFTEELHYFGECCEYSEDKEADKSYLKLISMYKEALYRNSR